MFCDAREKAWPERVREGSASRGRPDKSAVRYGIALSEWLGTVRVETDPSLNCPSSRFCPAADFRGRPRFFASNGEFVAAAKDSSCDGSGGRGEAETSGAVGVSDAVDGGLSKAGFRRSIETDFDFPFINKSKYLFSRRRTSYGPE